MEPIYVLESLPYGMDVDETLQPDLPPQAWMQSATIQGLLDKEKENAEKEKQSAEKAAPAKDKAPEVRDFDVGSGGIRLVIITRLIMSYSDSIIAFLFSQLANSKPFFIMSFLPLGDVGAPLLGGQVSRG